MQYAKSNPGKLITNLFKMSKSDRKLNRSKYLIIFCTLLYKRLIKYDLDSEEDAVANYMILSLQIDQMLPALKVK